MKRTNVFAIFIGYDMFNVFVTSTYSKKETVNRLSYVCFLCFLFFIFLIFGPCVYVKFILQDRNYSNNFMASKYYKK